MTLARRFFSRSIVLSCLLAPSALVGCDASKDADYAALDKHKDEYGRCGVMRESKEPIGGQPAWLAATTCDAQFRQAVAKDIKDFDREKFEKHFTAWQKDKGPAAVAAMRGKPITPSAPAAAPGGGISETERFRIMNDCNQHSCLTIDRLSPAHTPCIEECCRSKGMKENCRR